MYATYLPTQSYKQIPPTKPEYKARGLFYEPELGRMEAGYSQVISH